MHKRCDQIVGEGHGKQDETEDFSMHEIGRKSPISMASPMVS